MAKSQPGTDVARDCLFVRILLEKAEETVPSTNDSAINQVVTDWSHTTEDNPLFTSENMNDDDANPFEDDFGEGFGGNPIE